MPYDQVPYDPYGGWQQGGGYYPQQQQYWPQQGGGWNPYGQQDGYQQQAWPSAYNPYGQWQGYQQPIPADGPDIFAYGFDEDDYDEDEDEAVPQLPALPVKKSRELPKPLHAAMEIFYWVFIVVLVAGAVLFAASKDPRKNWFGYRTYNVITQSMRVTTYENGTTSPKGLGAQGGFNPGDTIIIKMDSPESIKVGDIITYNPNSRDTEGTTYLTHRVVEVLHELSGQEGLWFVTKGDHNPSEDPPITASMYIGRKVFHIPGIGRVLNLVKNHPIVSLMMFLSLFGCIFMLRWFFAKPKPKKTPPPPQET